jgi:hypothetical protein
MSSAFATLFGRSVQKVPAPDRVPLPECISSYKFIRYHMDKIFAGGLMHLGNKETVWLWVGFFSSSFHVGDSLFKISD